MRTQYLTAHRPKVEEHARSSVHKRRHENVRKAPHFSRPDNLTPSSLGAGFVISISSRQKFQVSPLTQKAFCFGLFGECEERERELELEREVSQGPNFQPREEPRSWDIEITMYASVLRFLHYLRNLQCLNLVPKNPAPRLSRGWKTLISGAFRAFLELLRLFTLL